MRNPLIRVRGRALASALAFTLCAFTPPARAQMESPVDAETEAPPPALVSVLPATFPPELAQTREALAENVRLRLRESGVDVRSARVRSAATTTCAMVAAAAAAGPGSVVLADLRVTSRGIDVALRVYEPAGCVLRAAARSAGTADSIGAGLDAALSRILPALGGAVELLAPEPLSIDQLAAESRALDAIGQRDLARAWRSLEGQDTPLARSLRVQIEALAAARETAPAERARLHLARGQTSANDAASRETLMDAARAMEGEPAPAIVLLAAAELRLRRGEAEDARTYLDKAVALEPSNPDIHLATGRALARLADDEGARRSFEQASLLEPGSSRALEELAQLEAHDPALQAAVLLRAGDRAAVALDIDGAKARYARALQLDPQLAPAANDHAAALHARLGDATQAKESWQAAIAAGGENATRLVGVAQASHALADAAGAETAYRRALELDPKSAGAATGLGVLYTETGRDPEARVLLESASALAPRDPEPKRALALVLQRAGESDAALALLRAADLTGGESPEGLRAQAVVLRERGDAAGARTSLARAIELDPVDAALRNELAGVHDLLGDATAANLERDQAVLFTAGSLATPDDATRTADGTRGIHDAAGSEPADERMLALLQTFGYVAPEVGRVARIEVDEPLAGRERWLDWVRWHVPDRSRLDAALARTIGTQYDTVPRGELEEQLRNAANRDRIEALLHFESAASRDASAVSQANLAFETDAIFLARIERAPRVGSKADERCGGETPWRLELRQLSGRSPISSRILANAICLESEGAYARVNPRALALIALGALFLIFQVVRGWGSVGVIVELPPQTRALFSVSLSRRPRKPRETKTMSSKAKAKTRIEAGLMRLNRYERPLRQGLPTHFSWITARRRPYYVAVRGPLFNTTTNELIGDFLEEHTVRVRRGAETSVKFDLRPKETVVEISVVGGEKSDGPAAVALKGIPTSLRYANEDTIFLYLKQGQYTLVVGTGDRLLERLFEIRSFENLKVVIDLTKPQDWTFTGSKAAVNAYLEGDVLRAAEELERAGNPRAAGKIRGEILRAKGDLGGAAKAYESGGDLHTAATLKAASDDRGGAAALFEAAGDFGEAAEAYLAAGDRVNAARAYERAGDFTGAIECAKELGDDELLLALYEKNGDSYEAGELALRSRQNVRALHAFRQVDPIDTNYRSACRRLIELQMERNQLAPALEKLEELVALEGGEEAPLPLRSVHARLLEKLGRGAEALEVWEGIEERSPKFPHAAERAAALRAEHRPPAPAATAPPADIPESRYEILEVLGRGAMGVVYKARDKHLGRIVALKRLTDSLRGHPTAIAYFEREARSAAMLTHPNIVVVYDAGQENGEYFITMEHLQGTTLEQIMEARGPMSAQVVASLGIQVCAGLHYAHANKIIHRDIKTANLFFTRERIVKIMDFGLAKMIEEVRKGATMVSGTPYYMAPEQALGENVDHRVDLYALGVTFFNLLTNTFPFASGDVTFHHRNTPAPDVRERVPFIPAEMAELVAKLMSKRPEARHQTAAEVAHLLQAIARSAPQAKPA